MNYQCEIIRCMAFAMSNQIENTVSAFLRGECGELHFREKIMTGGSGTGQAIVDPLGSQGSLALSRGGKLLFAVNAGNNTISSFRLERGRVELVSVVSSGGTRLVSIAVSNSLVYVVNAGSGAIPANLSGFRVDRDGELSPIPGSTTPLGPASVLPSCVVFSPDGLHLVVSLRGINRLVTFQVQPDGLLSNLVTTVSNGAGPFGMVFTKSGVLLVSEVGPNALSSYRLEPSGILTVISGSVHNGQSATCWVSVTPNGSFSYTSNAGSGTISLYRISQQGMLTLIESVPTTPMMNGSPIDSAIDPCGMFLYVLNGSQGSISVFRIDCEGHPVLIQIYQNTNLPEIGAQGIVVN